MIPIKIRYNSWGGVRDESKVIEYFADKWCIDNGYPVQHRRYIHNRKKHDKPTNNGEINER